MLHYGMVILVGCKNLLFNEKKEYNRIELYRPFHFTPKDAG
jgi:putative ubiquitin-RnfH superfamily antitoxin RatB of RatAB toxin-antitoxin module